MPFGSKNRRPRLHKRGLEATGPFDLSLHAVLRDHKIPINIVHFHWLVNF